MKKSFLFSLFFGAFATTVGPAFGQSFLDAAFGSSGIVTMPPVMSSTANIIRAVAIQPDQKILAAGIANDEAIVMRYNSSGAPDSTFGSNGIFL